MLFVMEGLLTTVVDLKSVFGLLFWGTAEIRQCSVVISMDKDLLPM